MCLSPPLGLSSVVVIFNALLNCTKTKISFNKFCQGFHLEHNLNVCTDSRSKYLKSSLRVWCFARRKEIKFSHGFYPHAKISCAVQSYCFDCIFPPQEIAENYVSLQNLFSHSHTQKCSFTSPKEFTSTNLGCAQLICEWDIYCFVVVNV